MTDNKPLPASADLPTPTQPHHVVPVLRFLPQNRTLGLHEPIHLATAAAECGILIEHPCGGKGECSKCRVRFAEGAPDPSPADLAQLTSEELAEGWRLSCQTVVSDGATVEAPSAELARGAKSFGAPDLFPEGISMPVVRRASFQLPETSLEHPICIEEALWAGLSGGTPAMPRPDETRSAQRLEMSPAVLGRLGVEPAIAAGRGEALLEGRRLIEVSPTGASPRHAIAVDLGSTTVAAALLDVETGAVTAMTSDLNPQIRYGADVIARIHHAIQQPDGNADLMGAARAVIADLIEALCQQAGLSPRDIVAGAVCGNSIMLHALAGADVRPFGRAPYTGVFLRDLDASARDLDLPMHPEARVWVFPQIRSTVGGDAVAAALAAGMDQAARPMLLIDLGTNSEILLGCSGWMMATSTAAGPAFEGVNIHHGMRASPGAIERVTLSPRGRMIIRIIGGQIPARGLCGSALVDAIAALLDAGVIEPSGRMKSSEEFQAASEAARAAGLEAKVFLPGRFALTDAAQKAVVIAEASESRSGRPILLTEQDVRALQLVKGSIRAGAELLMAEAGIGTDDLEAVCLAGAFGNYLRMASVLRVGLLPDVGAQRIRFIGNAAGVGARMAAVDLDARRRARIIARRCRFIEMAAHPDFSEAFATAMPFENPAT